MKHCCSLAFALLACCPTRTVRGQSAPVGWLRLSSEVTLAGPWSLYSEVETRQANSQLTAQYLGRMGLRRHFGSSLSLTAGYVLARNETQPDYVTATLPEHRFYQEIAIADVKGALRVSHRLRAEERWLRPATEAPFRFAPRMRYQLRLVAPLHRGGQLPVSAFYLVAADEAFAGLGNRGERSFLEENRLSAGLGYRLSQSATLEMAYLHQTQAAPLAGDAALQRNAVQVTLAYAPLVRVPLARRYPGSSAPGPAASRPLAGE